MKNEILEARKMFSFPQKNLGPLFNWNSYQLLLFKIDAKIS